MLTDQERRRGSGRYVTAQSDALMDAQCMPTMVCSFVKGGEGTPPIRQQGNSLESALDPVVSPTQRTVLTRQPAHTPLLAPPSPVYSLGLACRKRLRRPSTASTTLPGVARSTSRVVLSHRLSELGTGRKEGTR